MEQVVIGTAGHIDHGKTSLIRALTGVETDRLKAEKERGITIELGFSSIDISEKIHVGIVDMPGHEKFVKNMVAGSSGIDLVVMTIAADEGVMPQTREHMEICSLMNIRYGIIALTKTDLVDDDLLELAMEDIHEFIEGTFLEEAPIVPVSSATGEGLDEFVEKLGHICGELPERTYSSIFRLPVDRVFSMKGFGTVITGTLISGKVAAGRDIMVYPSKITSKVRGIQVHSKSVTEAHPGTRTAINFQGLDKDAVFKGDILSTPGALIPSFMMDVELKYLKSNSKPLKSRAKARFHTGTSETIGTVVLLDREELQPGDTACVQIRLDTPACCIKDDNYVIRSYSPIRTIGGGRILNPVARKHKLFDQDIIDGLNRLLDGEPRDAVSFFISQSAFEGVSFNELKVLANIPDKKLESLLQKMLAQREILQTSKENQTYIHADVFNRLCADIVAKLESYHARNPLKDGMPTQELKSKYRYLNDPKLFNILINRLSKDGTVAQEQNIVRLAGHEVALQVDQQETVKQIKHRYKQAGLTPPFYKDICRELNLDRKNARDVLDILLKEKSIIKTKDDLYFDADRIEELKKEVVAFLEKNGKITTPQFKEMTGISRKYVIPLIEYFDSINLTIRVGDTRQLRKKK